MPQTDPDEHPELWDLAADLAANSVLICTSGRREHTDPSEVHAQPLLTTDVISAYEELLAAVDRIFELELSVGPGIAGAAAPQTDVRDFDAALMAMAARYSWLELAMGECRADFAELIRQRNNRAAGDV
jgi:hypothetical protein